MPRLAFLAVVGCVITTGLTARGADWPQFLGPTRDAVSHEAGIIDSWPAGGPPVKWKVDVGQGWAAPVVVGGKVFFFDRHDKAERLSCRPLAGGNWLWSGEYPTGYEDDFGFDEGPRATPAVVEDRVYTFGAEGALHCWDAASGKTLWAVDTRERFHQNKGFFGMACSPLVEGDAVIVNIGADKAGVVAFDRHDGKTLWQATSDEAGYSSPVAASFAGKRYILSLSRTGLNALDPKTGQLYFHRPFHASISASVNAASPLVIGDKIFLSASYQTGAALLRFDEHGPETIWSGDDILSNHYSTSVYHDGHLYGFDGRQERGQRLRCVELATGKVKWSNDSFGAGTTILLDRPDHPWLLILSEKGDLVAVSASPDGYHELGRQQLVGFETRANAALADGFYIARGKSQLVCVDLHAPASDATKGK